MAFADIKSQIESQGSGLLGRDWQFPSDWPTDKTLDEYLNMVKGSDEYQAKQSGGSGSGEGPELSIPENAYPWSKTSLPQWGLDTVKQVSSQLPGLLANYQGAIKNLEQVPELLNGWMEQSGQAYLNGLNPFADYIRSPFEKANARGLGDGTISRDIAINLGGLLADDYQKTMSDLGAKSLELKATNLQNIASNYGQAYTATGQILDTAKQQEQENKLAQYEAMLNALLG